MRIAFQRPFVLSFMLVTALTVCANAMAQFGGGKDQPANGTPIADEPKEMIVLTVWVLALGDSTEHAGDESKSHLGERIDNLPAEFGSLKDVREFTNHLKSAGRLRASRELRLVTLDGQTARAQVGANKPRVIATTVGKEGRTNSLAMEAIGTLVEARTRIDSEKNIQVQLDYSTSVLQKSDDIALDEPADRKPRMADFVVIHQLKTTARLKSGTAVIVQSDSTSGSDDKARDGQVELIILGGAVLPAAVKTIAD